MDVKPRMILCWIRSQARALIVVVVVSVIIMMYTSTTTKPGKGKDMRAPEMKLDDEIVFVWDKQRTINQSEEHLDHPSDFALVHHFISRLPAKKRSQMKKDVTKAFKGHFGWDQFNLLSHRRWMTELQGYDYWHQAEKDEILRILAGTKKRLPSTIIAGCKKCGTAALNNYLGCHLRISRPKMEPHFFEMDGNYSMGLSYYMQNMTYSFPDQITVDKTPNYWISDIAMGRIYKFNPSIKLILILRDPLARLISDYVHDSTRGRIKEEFADYILAKNGDIDKEVTLLRQSLYDINIMNVYRYFNKSQVLILRNEDLSSNPHKVLHVVEDFLGLPHELDETRIVKGRDGYFCCNHPAYELRCLGKGKHQHHPEVSPKLKEKLATLLKPHMSRFYDIVEKDFGWKL